MKSHDIVITYPAACRLATDPRVFLFFVLFRVSQRDRERARAGLYTITYFSEQMQEHGATLSRIQVRR